MNKLHVTLASILALSFNLSAQNEALKIDQNGKVGINTSTPTEQLDVNGNIKATNVNATSVNATNVNATGSVNVNGTELMPIGGIIMWSGENPIPEGWKLCDGQKHGTVQTPNLIGRFIVGAGEYKTNEASLTKYTPGDKGGFEKVILEITHMPSHNHQVKHSGSLANSDADTKNGLQGWTADGKVLGVYVTDRNGSSSSGPVTYTGEGQGHENRPPYYALCYIMRVK
jgi:microcystin-dependent protein